MRDGHHGISRFSTGEHLEGVDAAVLALAQT
jgi:hypothetical protein